MAQCACLSSSSKYTTNIHVHIPGRPVYLVNQTLSISGTGHPQVGRKLSLQVWLMSQSTSLINIKNHPRNATGISIKWLLLPANGLLQMVMAFKIIN